MYRSHDAGQKGVPLCWYRRWSYPGDDYTRQPDGDRGDRPGDWHQGDRRDCPDDWHPVVRNDRPDD